MPPAVSEPSYCHLRSHACPTDPDGDAEIHGRHRRSPWSHIADPHIPKVVTAMAKTRLPGRPLRDRSLGRPGGPAATTSFAAGAWPPTTWRPEQLPRPWAA